MLNRRDFIKYLGITAGLNLLTSDTQDNEDKTAVPIKKGCIPADLHCHISKRITDSELNALFQRGYLIAATTKGTVPTASYEEIKQRLTQQGAYFEELKNGGIARVVINGHESFLLKNQEIVSAPQHILAVGIKDNVPDFQNPSQTIKYIHENGKAAILSHPETLEIRLGNVLVPFPSILHKDYEKTLDLAQKADTYESFNAFTLSFWRSLNFEADCVINKRLGKNKKQGISVSDSHYVTGHAGKGLTYIPSGKLSLDGIADYVKSGERLMTLCNNLNNLEVADEIISNYSEKIISRINLFKQF